MRKEIIIKESNPWDIATIFTTAIAKMLDPDTEVRWVDELESARFCKRYPSGMSLNRKENIFLTFNEKYIFDRKERIYDPYNSKVWDTNAFHRFINNHDVSTIIPFDNKEWHEFLLSVCNWMGNRTCFPFNNIIDDTIKLSEIYTLIEELDPVGFEGSNYRNIDRYKYFSLAIEIATVVLLAIPNQKREHSCYSTLFKVMKNAENIVSNRNKERGYNGCDKSKIYIHYTTYCDGRVCIIGPSRLPHHTSDKRKEDHWLDFSRRMKIRPLVYIYKIISDGIDVYSLRFDRISANITQDPKREIWENLFFVRDNYPNYLGNYMGLYKNKIYKFKGISDALKITREWYTWWKNYLITFLSQSWVDENYDEFLSKRDEIEKEKDVFLRNTSFSDKELRIIIGDSYTLYRNDIPDEEYEQVGWVLERASHPSTKKGDDEWESFVTLLYHHRSVLPKDTVSFIKRKLDKTKLSWLADAVIPEFWV